MLYKHIKYLKNVFIYALEKSWQKVFSCETSVNFGYLFATNPIISEEKSVFSSNWTHMSVKLYLIVR